MRKTFRGGIHPPEMKEATEALPLSAAPAPDEVVIPLVQHIGAPCQPCVKKGDEVKRGQRVGEPGGFVSAPVHASISGKVIAVEPRPHYLGRKTPAVVIQSDGKDEWLDGLNVETDISGLSREAIVERVMAAGLVGMGGATFPTHVKLSPPPDSPIDTLILNGAECEPHVTCDNRLMIERPEDIVAGLKLMMQLVHAGRGIIGVESNKPEACEALHRAAEAEEAISVEVLPTKYPQGSEKQLIFALTGRKVPAGGLPMAVNVVNQNVGTTIALYEAVRYGRPLVERALTITGSGVERPANLVVRIGTSIHMLLDQAGLKPDTNKLILGGPMMGLAQYTFDIPVTKGTNCILALADAESWEHGACIRCGRCLAACPMGLNPSAISIACEAKDIDAIKATQILDCFECGCCNYVCPSKRPIVHWVKFGKAELAKLKAQMQKKAADTTRQLAAEKA